MRNNLKIEIPNAPSTASQAIGIIFRNTRAQNLEYNNWGVDKAQHFFEFLGIKDS